MWRWYVVVVVAFVGFVTSACDDAAFCEDIRIAPNASCLALPDYEYHFDLEEAADRLTGRHETSLSWVPLDPFEAFDETNVHKAVLDIERHSCIARHVDCGGAMVSITGTFELPDHGSRFEFETDAYMRRDFTSFNVSLTADAGRALSDPHVAERPHDDRRYRLYLSIGEENDVRGKIATRRCDVALLPAEPESCRTEGSGELEWDTQVEGYALDEALAEMKLAGVQTLIGPDGAPVTDVEFQISKGDGPRCADPALEYSTGIQRLQAPVIVHVRTADGVLDLDIPAQMSAFVQKNKGLWVQEPPEWSDQLPTRVGITTTALAHMDHLRAAGNGRPSELDPNPPLALITLELVSGPEGFRGEFVLSPAEPREGQPIGMQAEPRAVMISGTRCPAILRVGEKYRGTF